MFRSIAIAMLVAAGAASPASAVVFVANFGGTAGNFTSLSVTDSGVTLTATARKFFAAPGSLTSLTQTVAIGQLSRLSSGIGVVGGADNLQIDTNFAGTQGSPEREGVLLTANRAFSLSNLVLSSTDANDTLRIYGVRNNGNLVTIGYGSSATSAGTIRGGLDGAALNLINSPIDDGTSTFDVSPTPFFTRYFFTTRIGGDVPFLGPINVPGGGQGYRIHALSANSPVPEPASWALMIIGFGLIGVAARRRSNRVASVAA